MQAPPPPLHGPLYVESVVVGVVVFPPVTQHLKSLPPGHFPLKVSPLHWLENTQLPLLPSLAVQGILSQHLTSFGSFGHFPE